MSAEEHLVLRELESEVEAELRMVQAGDADHATALLRAEWLFDPSDVERYRTGLYGLLGALKAVEGDPEPHPAIGDVMGGLKPTPNE